VECIIEIPLSAGSCLRRWNLWGDRRGLHHRIWAHVGVFVPGIWLGVPGAPIPADCASWDNTQDVSTAIHRELTEVLKGDPDGIKPATSTSDRTSPRPMHIALHPPQHHTQLQQVARG